MKDNFINTEPFLHVDNIVKVFDTKKIQISFSLAHGDTLALLGPSGCGKSTILKMISGLIKPDSGKIFLCKNDITDVVPHKRGIGMVFQDYALFPHLSVEDNIGYGLVASGLSKKNARKEASHWIKLFSLENLAKRKPDTLSGGEKQRTALARTLAVKPNIILFDEPLSALDQDLRLNLRVELAEHQKRFKYTAIYVTHDKEEASFLAKRTIIMK